MLIAGDTVDTFVNPKRPLLRQNPAVLVVVLKLQRNLRPNQFAPVVRVRLLRLQHALKSQIFQPDVHGLQVLVVQKAILTTQTRTIVIAGVTVDTFVTLRLLQLQRNRLQLPRNRLQLLRNQPQLELVKNNRNFLQDLNGWPIPDAITDPLMTLHQEQNQNQDRLEPLATIVIVGDTVDTFATLREEQQKQQRNQAKQQHQKQPAHVPSEECGFHQRTQHTVAFAKVLVKSRTICANLAMEQMETQQQQQLL